MKTPQDILAEVIGHSIIDFGKLINDAIKTAEGTGQADGLRSKIVAIIEASQLEDI